MSPKRIHISDFDYELPDNRIAKFPINHRDHSRLLVYRHGEITDDHFYNLPSYLPDNALMVFNNTKVIQARLHFRKSSGALIEVFLLEPAHPSDYEQMFLSREQCSWVCMIGNMKKWKEGSLERTIQVAGQTILLTATRQGTKSTGHQVSFHWTPAGISFAEILEAVGELPIPPYLNRSTQESDKITYQTVYSKIKGSVAAPTAGLHFTDDVLADIDRHGIVRDEVTLHVGAGTFKPVKSSELEGHEMHTEYICVQRNTLERLLSHHGHAIAVGTTSVRTLESLYYMGAYVVDHPDAAENELHVGQWTPYETHPALSSEEAIGQLLLWFDRHHLTCLHSSTQIIIAPDYNYHVVDMLVTNFHQPQSTLLLLVSAFLHGDWRKVYDYALAHDFRFLSYGDSSLLIP